MESSLKLLFRCPILMDERKHLEHDLAFVDGLLAKDGYHPYMRELLMEAKQKMEEELRVLDTVNLVPRIHS